MAIVRTRTQWIILVGGLVLLFALPTFAGPRVITLGNLIGISVISVLGLNILTGYCGQISLGQAAFMAVGAYTQAMLTVHLKWPFWAALPVSGVVAAIVGLVFGTPSLRVKGFYLAMATLAAQFVVPWMIVNVKPDITGGIHSFRVPAPALGGGLVLNTQTEMFYVIIPIAVIMTFFAKNIVRTRVGRAFVAIRDNDLAAEVMGVNVFRYKLLAFAICSFYAGIAGALWAHWMRNIAPTHFHLVDSIWYLGMLIVGGIGSTTGAVFGAVFIRTLDLSVSLLSPWVSSTFPAIGGQASAALSPLLFGLAILLFILFEPRGLYHRWEIFKAAYRLHPYSH
ncbi:MAG: branched-chain amino acid ABC transporter permease [Chloroflexota bacterium]